MPDIRVAWWNLENLFDRENAPSRDPILAHTLASELRGWTAAVRDQKLEQLATIIRQLFGGAGPDLLGVCEVENEAVLGLLAQRINNLQGRDYVVLNHASPDARGIDTSFIYDRNLLQHAGEDHQVVVKRSATRDIFWAEFNLTATGNVFVVVANHWPSRSGGQYASEPYRMLTGETVSFVLSDLYRQFDVGDRLPVLVVGDFNDEPFNRSMQEYLLGSRDAGRVRRARNPVVLNLMWPLMANDNPGTFRYGSNWNMLDQFLVTKGMLRQDSPVRVRADTAAIFRPATMLASGGAPRRFGRPSKPSSFDQNGFSDHFPITVTLRDDG